MTSPTLHLVRGRSNPSRQHAAVERLTRALSLLLLVSMLFSLLAPAMVQAQGLPLEAPAAAPDKEAERSEQISAPTSDKQAPGGGTVVAATSAPVTCAPGQQVYLPHVATVAGPVPSGN